jgi:hypothetical protein
MFLADLLEDKQDFKSGGMSCTGTSRLRPIVMYRQARSRPMSSVRSRPNEAAYIA